MTVVVNSPFVGLGFLGLVEKMSKISLNSKHDEINGKIFLFLSKCQVITYIKRIKIIIFFVNLLNDTFYNIIYNKYICGLNHIIASEINACSQEIPTYFTGIKTYIEIKLKAC